MSRAWIVSPIDKYTHTQRNSTLGTKIIYLSNLCLVPKIISRFWLDTERMEWLRQLETKRMDEIDIKQNSAKHPVGYNG